MHWRPQQKMMMNLIQAWKMVQSIVRILLRLGFWFEPVANMDNEIIHKFNRETQERIKHKVKISKTQKRDSKVSQCVYKLQPLCLTAFT